MKPVLPLLLAASGLLAAMAAAAAPQAAPAPQAAALPAGAGRETLLKVCASCHTPAIVANQRLDEAGWKDVVETMANNGANATDAELAEITGYLVRTFPASD